MHIARKPFYIYICASTRARSTVNGGEVDISDAAALKPRGDRE
jgi:hypothetical protein